MSATIEQRETHTLVRLEGAVSVTSAAELKELLVQALAYGTELHLDLEQVAEIDTAGMQLLWAAEREAERVGVRFAVRPSDAAANAMRDAGFADFPETRG